MNFLSRRFGFFLLSQILIFFALSSMPASADSFYQIVNGKRYLCNEQPAETGPGCRYINGAVYCPGPGETCSYINGAVYCGFGCKYINGAVYCPNQGGRCDYINGNVHCSTVGQTCQYINGAVYCGSNCSYINGAVHCSSGGRSNGARPSSPATPSRGN